MPNVDDLYDGLVEFEIERKKIDKIVYYLIKLKIVVLKKKLQDLLDSRNQFMLFYLY